ncbi:toll/interleukin-1 receptor domain-containing protein [Mycobacteroides chelonae]|uniref:toll/interleukin-1 receptor domain-containing protein n=1 Tax=Mycobacteroides chelonae TaxID=1774 RepID=UPI001F3514ED|nr:toll/interleukin-1 receptor domain-containing protein [Mycobacteroides chelonae]
MTMAGNSTDGHAFISYVHQDTAPIDRLCAVLNVAGIPNWRDKDALGPGDEWRTKIRDAIRSDSLAFLACFSSSSTSKDKSYQNEELALAVEEFRLRPPGRTWLIPVRLDECDIPDWDLGAGRRLADINYIDLFGDQHAENAVKLIETIKKVMGLGAVDADMVRISVGEASESARPALLRALTKEMIRDPGREIELDELIAQEAASMLVGMRDTERFPMSFADRDLDQHLLCIAQMSHDYWQLVAPFCASLQVAARWGTPETLRPWTKGIKAVNAEALKSVGGPDTLTHLRHLPALLTVSVAALACTGQNRWENFRALLIDNTIVHPRFQGKQVAMIEAVNPYEPFSPSAMPAIQALARSANEGTDLATALADLKKLSPLHTPVAEWLFDIFKPLFVDQFPDDTDYAAEFDRAEIAVGVVNQDLAAARIGDSGRRPIYLVNKWFGRSTWRYASRRSDPLQDFTDEQEQHGSQWPPLLAGLFSGSIDRARAATQQYADEFKEIARGRW